MTDEELKEEAETVETAADETVNEAEKAVETADDAVNEAEMAAEPAGDETDAQDEGAADADLSADAEEVNAGSGNAGQDTPSGKKERTLGWTKKAKEKSKKADEERAALEAKVSEANDRYTRLFAEFDNYRKRTDKEKSAMFGMGAKDVLEKILPVVDNFERGLALVEEEDKEDAFAVGMDKIYKQFMQVLEGMGVTPIEAVGKEFDPNFHNAVMHVDDESVGENIIVEEFQKGYMYKDALLRPSMVKVAN